MALDRQRHSPVLREALLGDVEVRSDLHTGNRAGDHAPGDGGPLLEHSVDAEADPHLAAMGLEVDIRCAVLDGLRKDRVDELDDGPVVRRLADVGDLGEVFVLLLDGLSDGIVQPAHPSDHTCDVLARGHDRLHLVARHELEVVERKHVRGIRDRDHQGAVLAAPDRHRLETSRRLHGDQVDGPGIGLEEVQVRVQQPEALGDRARQLVLGQGAALDEDLIRRPAGGARFLYGRVHSLAGQHAELDDDVGDEARAAPHRPRRGQAGAWFALGRDSGVGPRWDGTKMRTVGRVTHLAAGVADFLGESLRVDITLDQPGAPIVINDHDRRRLVDADALDEGPIPGNVRDLVGEHCHAVLARKRGDGRRRRAIVGSALEEGKHHDVAAPYRPRHGGGLGEFAVVMRGRRRCVAGRGAPGTRVRGGGRTLSARLRRLGRVLLLRCLFRCRRQAVARLIRAPGGHEGGGDENQPENSEENGTRDSHPSAYRQGGPLLEPLSRA